MIKYHEVTDFSHFCSNYSLALNSYSVKYRSALSVVCSLWDAYKLTFGSDCVLKLYVKWSQNLDLNNSACILSCTSFLRASLSYHQPQNLLFILSIWQWELCSTFHTIGWPNKKSPTKSNQLKGREVYFIFLTFLAAFTAFYCQSALVVISSALPKPLLAFLAIDIQWKKSNCTNWSDYLLSQRGGI